MRPQDILPCPFCGAVPETMAKNGEVIRATHPGRRTRSVGAGACFLTAEIFSGPRLDKWNKRAEMRDLVIIHAGICVRQAEAEAKSYGKRPGDPEAIRALGAHAELTALRDLVERHLSSAESHGQSAG